MHHVVETIERPDDRLIEQLDGLPSAVLSDVTTKYENTMDSGITPVAAPSMAGTAVTVKTYPGDNLMIHKAVTLAEAGDVLVIDANGYTEAGLVGELLATSCKTHGLAGIVIDGAVRDVPELTELEFPVYARATCPKGSYKAHPGSINVPISCGAIPVEPGDIVVGDAEGVVVIDPERAEDVAARAERKLEEEAAMRTRIEAGEYIYDIADLDESYQDLALKTEEP